MEYFTSFVKSNLEASLVLGLDDFKVFPNVDVGWAYAWTDLPRLKILRIAYCKEG